MATRACEGVSPSVLGCGYHEMPADIQDLAQSPDAILLVLDEMEDVAGENEKRTLQSAWIWDYRRVATSSFSVLSSGSARRDVSTGRGAARNELRRLHPRSVLLPSDLIAAHSLSAPGIACEPRSGVRLPNVPNQDHNTLIAPPSLRRIARSAVSEPDIPFRSVDTAAHLAPLVAMPPKTSP
eukprot:388381-Rhodomonas_salina.3